MKHLLHKSAAALFALLFVFVAAALPQKVTTPAFSDDPTLDRGFRLLYEQRFPDARTVFAEWINQHPSEPFGQIALAASYLFEEFMIQNVLTSDYFLDDKRFIGGITGSPDPERMKHFLEALTRARKLAFVLLKKNARDPEGLYTLTMAAGMESDASSILLKRHYDGLKHLKEANVNAEMLLADHPEAADAYVALGSANYIIGSLPSTARFVLWFGGIHGDKVLGMQQVMKTAQNGHYLRPFAKILLALSARREKQDALAQKLLKELTDEFPSNSTYAAEYAKAMGRPVPATLSPAK